MNIATKVNKIIEEANQNASWLDTKEKQKMSKLFESENDKALILDIADQSFRPKKSKDVALVVRQLLRKYGFPSFLSAPELLMLKSFYHLSPIFHQIAVPLFKWYMIKMTSRYVTFGNLNKIAKKIRFYQKDGIHTNINRVGELLLGEKDAAARTKQYIDDLSHPDIKCISIKASTLYSQINLVAFDQTVDAITEKLVEVYKAAKENKYIDEEGREQYKLVNLDMEEYRDLYITLAAFRKALNHPELKDLRAGIALQAYLPDSYYVIKKIVNFAKHRVKNGGSPIRVRIVKGANMEMELFESCERHWELATFNQKHHTDANYKKIIEYLLEDENYKYVNAGIASHNVFDICYLYEKIKEKKAQKYFTWEMLSGMCYNVAKVISKKFDMPVLLYLPFSDKDKFINSISYLVRRFEENTSIDNYLRYINSISKDNLKTIEEKFNLSLEENLSDIEMHRTQNRLEEEQQENFENAYKTGEYKAEPDTDFTLLRNLKWLKKHKNKFFRSIKNDHISIPTIKAKEELFLEENTVEIFDQNNDQQLIAKYNNASPDDAKEMLQNAKDDRSWADFSIEERLKIIAKAANLIKISRGELLMKMAADTGKIFTESDVEISEAVDFCEFYSHSYSVMNDKISNAKITPRGTVLVLSPWNFPFAIPIGGIVASLISGNNVIYKPSDLAILSGFSACEILWKAGVPKSALQFCPTNNIETAITLTKSNLLDFIVFTGSTKTALDIMKNNPKVDIAAETGGKNFTIATKYCDRDQVIKNVLHSAFSNSGQKCSATSVLALDDDLYYDQEFLSHLKDAASSLKTSFAWQEDSKVGPLIRKPANDLEYALNNLEKGESWLLEPKQLDKAGILWSPGIKYGVKRGSKSHLTEFFGPVLAIMRMKSFKDGIKLANQSGYGLTSGIETLNRAQRDFWKQKIKAGNIYLNRGTTGAIVNRQPFGGLGKSAYGSGIKAGGYNYIYQFVDITEETSAPTPVIKEHDELSIFLKSIGFFEKISHNQWFVDAAKSYLYFYNEYFSREIDYTQIPGQMNVCRFIEVNDMALYINRGTPEDKLYAAIFAYRLCNKKPKIIFESEREKRHALENRGINAILEGIKLSSMSLKEFTKKIENFSRIRFTDNSKLTDEITQQASKNGVYVIRKPVYSNGRAELLNYMQEQSISHNYHRYGYYNFLDREEVKEMIIPT